MGSQLTLVALAYQTFHLTHSTFMVGLLGFIGLVPLLAGALWGGTLADAWDRRRVLTLTQMAMAAAVAGLAVNAALDHPRGVGAVRLRGGQRRVPGDRLAGPTGRPAHAGGRRTTSPRPSPSRPPPWRLAMVVGPGPRRHAHRPARAHAVYLIDVASFAVSLVTVVLLPRLVPTGGGTPMGLRSMAEGFRHLKGERLLSATYWIDLNAMIFGMPRAVFPALAVHLYGGGAGVVGPALRGTRGRCAGRARCSPGGRPASATRAGPSPPASSVWGGTIAVFGLVPVLWVGLALLAVAGAADVISAVFRQNVQQRAVPDHLQGRLSGTFFAVVAGGPRLGDLETGRGRGHRRSRVRRLVGRAGLRHRGRGPAVAGARAVGRRRGRAAARRAPATEEAVAEAITELGEGEPF